MGRSADHNESKSASGADGESAQGMVPTRAEISDRAHKLWLEQGKPPDSAERNWLEAERELKAAAKSRSLVEKSREKGGSVQP